MFLCQAKFALMRNTGNIRRNTLVAIILQRRVRHRCSFIVDDAQKRTAIFRIDLCSIYIHALSSIDNC